MSASRRQRANQGELFDAEFQPGSGSWDGLAGLAWTHRVGVWSFDSNVLYSMSSEGTQNTDLGDRFQYNFAVSYRLTALAGATPSFNGGHAHTDASGHNHAHGSDSPTLDLVLELNGEWQAEQETNGIGDPNSGGNTILISPGLRLSQDAWSGFVSVGILSSKILTASSPSPTGASWLAARCYLSRDYKRTFRRFVVPLTRL